MFTLGSLLFFSLTMSITGLVVDFDEIKNTDLNGICGKFLFYKMVAAVAILSLGLVFTIFLMVVSLRGSILDDRPRKSAQYLIYILLGKHLESLGLTQPFILSMNQNHILYSSWN